MTLNELTTSEDWKTFEPSLTSQISFGLPLQSLASELATPSTVEEITFSGKDNKAEPQLTCENIAGCNLVPTKIVAWSSSLSRPISRLTSLSEDDIKNEFTDHVITFNTYTRAVETEKIRQSSGTGTKIIEPLTNNVSLWSELHQMDMNDSISLPLSVSEPQTSSTGLAPEIIRSENISLTEEFKGAVTPYPLASESDRPSSDRTLIQDLNHDISGSRLTRSDFPNQTKSITRAAVDLSVSLVSSLTTQSINAIPQSHFTTTGSDKTPQTTKDPPGLPQKEGTMQSTQASKVMSARGWHLILGTVSGASLAFACIFYLQRLCYARVRKDKKTIKLGHIPHDKLYEGELIQQQIPRNIEVSRFSEDS